METWALYVQVTLYIVDSARYFNLFLGKFVSNSNKLNLLCLIFKKEVFLLIFETPEMVLVLFAFIAKKNSKNKFKKHYTLTFYVLFNFDIEISFYQNFN